MHKDSVETLYIPFETNKAVGGPSTFMANLEKFLIKKEFKYSSIEADAKNIFFPVQYNLVVLDKIKKLNGKIIQRLDGIYYPSKHGDKHIELNSDIKEIYLKYADHIVFQSEYSRKQCFEMLGIKEQQNYSIIINGVNKEIFIPDNNRTMSGIIELVTTGNFRNIDMIEPVVLALDTLAGKFDFHLNVIGPVVNESLKSLLKRDYVVMRGLKTIYEIAEVLPNMDIFIYSNLNPPCPNSVIEAISCGLPVVGFDSGSMSELCWFSKDLLAYVSDDIFQKYDDFNPEALAEKIELCIDNYGYYRKLALDHSNLYSFEECGTKYMKVFNDVLAQNSHDNTASLGGNDGHRSLKYRLKNKINQIRQKSVLKFNDENLLNLMFDERSRRTNLHDPSDALRLLFTIDNRLYDMEGRA